MNRLLALCLLSVALAQCKVASTPPVPMTEAQYYKAMYEQASINAYNSVSVAWAAIGVVVTLIVFLFALKTFIDNKNIETQVQSARTSILSDVNARFETLSSSIQQVGAQTQGNYKIYLADFYMNEAGSSLALQEVFRGASQLITAESVDASYFNGLDSFLIRHLSTLSPSQEDFLKLQDLLRLAANAPQIVNGTITGRVLNSFGYKLGTLKVIRAYNGANEEVTNNYKVPRDIAIRSLDLG